MQDGHVAGTSPGGARVLQPSDADLARRWAVGDPAAFEEAYRRFAGPLFGTAVGLLGDRTAASDVVHDTFVRAAARVDQLRDPDRLRAWLFAILRNEATSVHRSRRHDGGSIDAAADGWGGPAVTEIVDPAAPADVEVARGELAELVWAAADGLQDRDREVLELSVRGGLETADLADVLGVTAGHAAVLLSRMRDRLEKCLGALLVARQGRTDCDALDRMLEGWDGRFSLDVRSRVTRHVEACPRCGQRRAAMVSMERLAPALLPPAVLLPTDLRTRLVSSLGQQGGTAALSAAAGAAAVLPDWGWRDDGFPVAADDAAHRVGADVGDDPWDAEDLPLGVAGAAGAAAPGAHRMHRRRVPLLAVVAVGVVLLGGGGAVVLSRGPAGDDAALPAGVTVVPSDGTSSSGAAGTTLLPDTSATTGPTRTPGTRTTTTARTPTSSTSSSSRPAVTSSRPVTTSAPVTPSVTTTTPTVTPTTTTPTTTTKRPDGPAIVRVAASPSSVFAATGTCTPTRSRVTVAVTSSGTPSVTASWAGGSADLGGGPTVFTGSVGPFRRAGVSVTVTVRDEYGKASASVPLEVADCVVIQ